MASEHGGLNYSELRENGINPDDVIDFSVSINPDPLPEAVLTAIRESRVTRYPDSGCNLLREKIADINHVETEEILVVNGTSQGMFLIVSSLLKENQPVCIVQPTYSEYEDASRLKTSNIIEIRMEKSDNFSISAEKIISSVIKKKPALLWLCSPNNPSGRYLEEDQFELIRKACVKNGTILILDEAYVCFVVSEKRYNPLRKNVIVLRSMTKDFSIPGLRLGYLMAEEDLISSIKKWQPEWSISSPAQDAGIAGYNEIQYFQKSWKKTAQRRDFMRKGLKDLGLTVYNSCSNFFLVEINDTESLKTHLWKDLILVRDCASFKLKNMIRIGVRTEKDNTKLINSIREYLKK
jgi:histidinol-phosphate aminotransferase